MQQSEQPVDQPDAWKGRNETAQSIDPKVAAQHRGSTLRSVFHSPQRQRHERDDDQSVEDHRSQHGALGSVKAHDVELS